MFVAVVNPSYAQKPPTPKSAAKVAPTRAAAPTDLPLSRLTSEKHVFSLLSSGWKAPAADSKNKSEQFWAEESVQKFLQQFVEECLKQINEKSQGSDEAKLGASTVPVLLSAAFQHPLAISLISFSIDPTPDVNLSIVIDTESDADKVREAFQKLIDAAPKDGPDALAEETFEGVKFYRPLLGDPNLPAPKFGMYKSHLILVMGKTTAEDTLQKIFVTGKTPTWIDTSLKEAKIERPSLVWHLDAEAILKTIDPLLKDQKIRKALDASGLLALKRIDSVSGLDAVSSVSKMVIETNGPPKGLLGLIPDKPLTTGDLKGIPDNAVQASVVRFDLGQAVETIVKAAEKVEPSVRQQYDMVSSMGEGMLGFSFKNDFLKGLGDVWTTWTGARDTGNGFLVAISVKDQKKLQKVQESLIKLATPALQQGTAKLNDFTFRAAKGYQLDIPNLPPTLSISPTWVISRDQFIIGSTKEIVTTHLTAATSLADNESVKAALKREPKTVMLTYRDPKPELQALIEGAPTLQQAIQQAGGDFTIPPFPPFADVEPHLAPSVSTTVRTQNGWRTESHGVVPSLSAASPATVAVAVALLLPAVQQAREAARRTQAKNNLKEIALGLHNYESTYRSFPERVVLDKNKKPGLSWRVKILPLLGENELYQQFHLDEPWDSEHNKPLLKQMPRIFVSPNDPELSQEGKTRYMVLVSDGALFSGDVGPQIASITDGTSNTIMTVETTPDQAVYWTKPDDLQVNPNDVLAGLRGARMGGFHIGLADGSIRFVSDNIDVKVFKALITKAGGEPVGDF